jgi:hypothetical protein
MVKWCAVYLSCLDEKWLELCPKDLDAMLEERYGPKKFVETNRNSNPSDFSAQLAKFLNHMSGVDGAEYPGYWLYIS